MRGGCSADHGGHTDLRAALAHDALAGDLARDAHVVARHVVVVPLARGQVRREREGERAAGEATNRRVRGVNRRVEACHEVDAGGRVGAERHRPVEGDVDVPRAAHGVGRPVGGAAREAHDADLVDAEVVAGPLHREVVERDVLGARDDLVGADDLPVGRAAREVAARHRDGGYGVGAAAEHRHDDGREAELALEAGPDRHDGRVAVHVLRLHVARGRDAEGEAVADLLLDHGVHGAADLDHVGRAAPDDEVEVAELHHPGEVRDHGESDLRVAVAHGARGDDALEVCHAEPRAHVADPAHSHARDEQVAGGVGREDELDGVGGRVLHDRSRVHVASEVHGELRGLGARAAVGRHPGVGLDSGAVAGGEADAPPADARVRGRDRGAVGAAQMEVASAERVGAGALHRVAGRRARAGRVDGAAPRVEDALVARGAVTALRAEVAVPCADAAGQVVRLAGRVLIRTLNGDELRAGRRVAGGLGRTGRHRHHRRAQEHHRGLHGSCLTQLRLPNER